MAREKIEIKFIEIDGITKLPSGGKKIDLSVNYGAVHMQHVFKFTVWTDDGLYVSVDKLISSFEKETGVVTIDREVLAKKLGEVIRSIMQ